MIEIGFLGHGVVGSGVVEVLFEHKDRDSKGDKMKLNINKFQILKEFPDSPFELSSTKKSFPRHYPDDDVKILVEVMVALYLPLNL